LSGEGHQRLNDAETILEKMSSSRIHRMGNSLEINDSSASLANSTISETVWVGSTIWYVMPATGWDIATKAAILSEKMEASRIRWAFG